MITDDTDLVFMVGKLNVLCEELRSELIPMDVQSYFFRKYTNH